MGRGKRETIVLPAPGMTVCLCFPINESKRNHKKASTFFPHGLRILLSHLASQILFRGQQVVYQLFHEKPLVASLPDC